MSYRFLQTSVLTAFVNDTVDWIHVEDCIFVGIFTFIRHYKRKIRPILNVIEEVLIFGGTVARL